MTAADHLACRFWRRLDRGGREPAAVELLERKRKRPHGDFVAKNLVVRGAGDSAGLVVLDWESAGVASPAADLAAFGSVPEPKIRGSITG